MERKKVARQKLALEVGTWKKWVILMGTICQWVLQRPVWHLQRIFLSPWFLRLPSNSPQTSCPRRRRHIPIIVTKGGISNIFLIDAQSLFELKMISATNRLTLTWSWARWATSHGRGWPQHQAFALVVPVGQDCTIMCSQGGYTCSAIPAGADATAVA